MSVAPWVGWLYYWLTTDDYLNRAAEHQDHIWFVVRYSNGAVHPDEVSHWPLSKLAGAVMGLGKWLDNENKNSRT